MKKLPNFRKIGQKNEKMKKLAIAYSYKLSYLSS